MKWITSQPLAMFRQTVRRSLPVLVSTIAGAAAGVALVISCDMGPPAGMAQTTTGGTTGGGTTGGTSSGGATGGATTSGGATGGTTGGGTSGGSTTGGGTGGCNGSCTCTLSGPISLTGSVKSVPASEDSAQLVSGQLPFLPGGAPGAFDCSAIAQNGVLVPQGGTASCIKLVDGPFVLTDVISLYPLYGNTGTTGTTWVFAAPPSAGWDASTRAQWFVSQVPITPNAALANSGMRYMVPSGSSLFAVSTYGSSGAVSFSWAGYKPYQ